MILNDNNEDPIIIFYLVKHPPTLHIHEMIFGKKKYSKSAPVINKKILNTTRNIKNQITSFLSMSMLMAAITGTVSID